MQDTRYPAFFTYRKSQKDSCDNLKVVRILYRDVIGIFHKTRITPEGIRYDHRFLSFFFHAYSPPALLFRREQELMIAFFRSGW